MRKAANILIYAGILIYFALTLYFSYISMPLLRVMLILMFAVFAIFLFRHIHVKSKYVLELEKLKLALKEYDKSKYFLSLLNLHSPIAHALIDRNFTIQFINNAVKNITGYRPEEVVGKKCYTLFGPGHVCPGCAVLKCFNDGQPHNNVKLEVNRMGKEIALHQRAVPFEFAADGSVATVLEIANDVSELYNAQRQLEEDFSALIESLISIIELKDEYTSHHSSNVRKWAVMLGEKMGLSERELRDIELAAILHDIGKIGIPTNILNKPGPLSPEEYGIVKLHPVNGEKTLAKIKRLEKIRKIIRHHHERFDGKGYPDGLKGEEIPLIARIIAIADAFNAMTSDRSYRKALSIKEALAEIEKGAGTQFDPVLAKLFVDMVNEGK